MLLARVAPVLVCVALSRAPLGAQAAPVSLSVEARQRVIDSLTRAVEQLYPAADTGRAIAEYVRLRAAEGAYRNAADPTLFARLVTQDLQVMNEDTHLSVSVMAPQGSGPPPSGHGVERVERLDGNIGYMRMSHFLGGDVAANAVAAGLRYLETTDAIILDLRNSRGGSAGLANLVISHFTGPDTVHSLTVFDRVRNTTTERYTLAQVPGPRRPDVPLFILVDDVTRSAAEDVPFVLQNMRRATLVGSNTAGAGRNNRGVPLGEGLVASVSFTRVFDPRTRREWERTGITPDVRVHPDSALPVAHGLALEMVAQRSTDASRKRELALLAEGVRAAARPAMSDARLRRYAGTYEGGQFVTVHDGRLVYQSRVAQPRIVLVPLEGAAFAAGSSRYVFEGVGLAGMRLRITDADGRTSVSSRTSATTPQRRR